MTESLAGARVGFIGLGVMGGGMARCLLRRGFDLVVHARQPASAQALVAAGAQLATSPAELGRACRIVILSLPDAAAVEAVLFGAQGLAEGLAPGAVVVDTSTIAPASAREFGAQLQVHGCTLLDAPVSGGQQGAEAGTLGCMVGGPADALAAFRPVLEAFCQAITHVGALGAGQAVKACNQVAVSAALLGVAEAIALAQAEGVDLRQMREVLLGGSARSFSLDKHAPRIIDRSFAPGFRAVLMRKDLRLALAAAASGGLTLPVATLAAGLLQTLCDSGRGDLDWSALALELQGADSGAAAEGEPR